MPELEYNCQPKPDSLNYQNLIAKIESGTIKIPQFQRKFVWEITETASLLDSILKGYPIGSFIIWKTQPEPVFPMPLKLTAASGE